MFYFIRSFCVICEKFMLFVRNKPLSRNQLRRFERAANLRRQLERT